jgi:hypothetical protein
MIKLRQPSLVLHSCDVPGYKYEMWKTWTMPRGASASDVVYWINWGIDHSPEMELHNVVINCHGSPGGLHVGGCNDSKKGISGGSAIWAGDTAIFKNVRRGSLGTIYIVACEVAKSDTTAKLGENFCKQLAINAGCFVVAADALQSVDFFFQVFRHPYGAIDDYEGNVMEFGPSGGMQPWNPADATGLQN